MALRLYQMLKKEFLLLLRDRRMRTVLFVMPAIQVLVFGYAATNDVREVPTAVYDLDRTPQSRELAARFMGSGFFHEVARPRNEAEIREALDSGTVGAVLRMDAGYGADILAGRTAGVQLLLDGADSNTSAVVLSYASAIVAAYSRDVRARRVEVLLGAPPRFPGVTLKSRAWFNENLISRNYFLPGIIANLVLIISLMLTGMAVVREVEIGTIEQVLVTPLRPLEIMLGKTLPFAAVGVGVMVIVSAVGINWFDVPIRGNPLVLLLGTLLYLMSTVGAGLMISTVSRTQQQAMMSTFFFVFPAILLSGFAFPIDNMPSAIQWLTYLNPVRYYLVIIRGVFLKGVGIDVLWPQMAALALLGTATLAFASARFRRTLV